MGLQEYSETEGEVGEVGVEKKKSPTSVSREASHGAGDGQATFSTGKRAATSASVKPSSSQLVVPFFTKSRMMVA